MTDGIATTVLQQVAATAPASFVHRSDSVRVVRQLYEQCNSARLTTDKAPTDVEALEVVFSVALRNGLGCLVLDYVHEVCSSSSLVSSDPVDAALLDGATVEHWCAKALQKCKDRVLEQLNNMGLQRLKASSILQQESGCTNSLLLVVQALNQPGRNSGQAMLLEAKRLQQLFRVLEWSATQQLLPRAGRFASFPDWRTAVNKRASAVQHVTPFLQDLIICLTSDDASQGVTSSVYPPESLADFVQNLFLHGDTDQAAFRHKLALLLYCLLDRQGGAAGQKLNLASFRAAFDLHRVEVEEWHCQFLLDDALSQTSQSAPASLQAACTILPGVASSSRGLDQSPTPFKFVEVLTALGRPDAALAVLHARAPVSQAGRLSCNQAFQEAQTALAVRLHCGVFTQACSELRGYCEGLSQEQKGGQTAVLIRQLADWGLAVRQMHEVMRLPLSGLEEQILVQWFQEQAQIGQRVAYMLPLYYLQRSRMAEALHAYAGLKDSFAGGPGTPEQQQRQQQLERLLASAAKMLPAAQQGLATAPPDTPGPALSLDKASALGQGTRSILSGIQNLQLASDVSSPTLLIRQQGKLAPPLLASTIQHSNLSSSDLCLHSPGPHEAATATPATPIARSSARFSHLGASAFNTSASPAASSLMTGRLSKQGKPQDALPSAPGGHAAAEVSTPQADTVAAGQDTPETAVTPGTMTQEQWDALMQTGSIPPVSGSKAAGSKTTGRKKAVRPVLKKQRMNSIALD
ncbi:hypothetical protein ABBQ32_000799 [Trebouxia sp. C0010 RCD-2024]